MVLHAALLITLHHPYNIPEHRINVFPALPFGVRISDLPSKYGKALIIASEFEDARFCTFCSE